MKKRKFIFTRQLNLQYTTLNKWLRVGKYPTLLSMLLNHIEEEDLTAIDYDIMPCVSRADIVKLGFPIGTQDKWQRMPKDTWQYRLLITARWALAKGWVIV